MINHYTVVEVADMMRTDARTVRRWAFEDRFKGLSGDRPPIVRTPGRHLLIDAPMIDAILSGEITFAPLHYMES